MTNKMTDNPSVAGALDAMATALNASMGALKPTQCRDIRRAWAQLNAAVVDAVPLLPTTTQTCEACDAVSPVVEGAPFRFCPSCGVAAEPVDQIPQDARVFTGRYRFTCDGGTDDDPRLTVRLAHQAVRAVLHKALHAAIHEVAGPGRKPTPREYSAIFWCLYTADFLAVNRGATESALAEAAKLRAERLVRRYLESCAATDDDYPRDGE